MTWRITSILLKRGTIAFGIVFITFSEGKNILSAQSYEQIAVDYYAEEIYPNLEKVKVYYDGKVSTFDTSYQNMASRIIFDFTGCNLYEVRRDSTARVDDMNRWLDAMNSSVDIS